MTEFQQVFTPLGVEEIHNNAQTRKVDGWRFVQILAVNTEEGVDLIYSFMKDGLLNNYQVSGVTGDMTIPSISDLFLEAFVFENEIHDLFGVHIQDIAIDFGGKFYALAVDEPMTIMTPEEFEERKAKRRAARQAEIDAAAAEASKASEAHNTSDAPADADSAPSDAAEDNDSAPSDVAGDLAAGDRDGDADDTADADSAPSETAEDNDAAPTDPADDTAKEGE